MTRIWLDDTLPPPDSSYDAWCKSATGAIAVLRLCRVTYISFDVDLGAGGSGVEVARWIADRSPFVLLPDYDVHSTHSDAQRIVDIMETARQVLYIAEARSFVRALQAHQEAE